MRVKAMLNIKVLSSTYTRGKSRVYTCIRGGQTEHSKKTNK